jgi:phosphoglycerate dehydrogenase-like enzyme
MAVRRLIVVTAPFDQATIEPLRERYNLHVEARPGHGVGDVEDALWREVEILLTFASLPDPARAPNLRWVQLWSAGAEQALTHPLIDHHVQFTTASGVHAAPGAEYVFATILNHFRYLPQIREHQQRHEWLSQEEGRRRYMGVPLWGKTLGIVGYGSIGRQVARVAQAFGMRVVAMQRGSDHRERGFVFPNQGDPDGTIPAAYYAPEDLHRLLAESDVVLIAVPLTPRTRKMFDAAAFAAMKRGAFLVNLARGAVVDEDALVHALQDGQLSGAASDVFNQEPLPADNPLWDAPNLLITPHMMGFNPQYAERVGQIFAENLRRFLEGEPLLNAVGKEQGY